MYPSNICLLRKNTAYKLSKANMDFKKIGCRIKIWAAYRPISVQKIFWDIVRDKRFVANPAVEVSTHSTGCAVDITLVDQNGIELLMPSKFDDFSTNAYPNNPKTSEKAKENLNLLVSVMKKNGFNGINTEWWHFEDEDYEKYKPVDIDLKIFES